MVRSKVLLAQIFELGDVLLERRVVHQDVELAEFLDCLGHRRLAKRWIGDITGQEDAAAALLLHRTFGFGSVIMFVQIGDGDVSALAGE
jgi:hypothetical protein